MNHSLLPYVYLWICHLPALCEPRNDPLYEPVFNPSLTVPLNLIPYLTMSNFVYFVSKPPFVHLYLIFHLSTILHLIPTRFPLSFNSHFHMYFHITPSLSHANRLSSMALNLSPHCHQQLTEVRKSLEVDRWIKYPFSWNLIKRNTM